MPRLWSVIMAGGRGERFWPLSTRTLPKPFIPLLGPVTLIQDTAARIEPLTPPERTLISIGAGHYEIARRQLPRIPEGNFIVEPVGRDTSACLGLCALHLEKRDPDAVMLALPADHYVGDNASFIRAIETGLAGLDAATGIVFGIRPTRPETGYGYILAPRPEAGGAIWPVEDFVEKPDAGTAARYLADGGYFWNSGMFLWPNRTLLGLFREHLPETSEGLDRLRPLIGRDGVAGEVRARFEELPRISIDFGIVEKTPGLGLVPVSFAWDDIGNWASLDRALSPDAAGNVVRGRHTAVDSTGCVVYAQSATVATLGVSDLVVVEAYGKVLVCSKAKAAELKRLVAALAPEEG